MGAREDASTAEGAAAREILKHQQVSTAHHASFIPFSLDSTGGMSRAACDLLNTSHSPVMTTSSSTQRIHGWEQCRVQLLSLLREATHTCNDPTITTIAFLRDMGISHVIMWLLA